MHDRRMTDSQDTGGPDPERGEMPADEPPLQQDMRMLAKRVDVAVMAADTPFSLFDEHDPNRNAGGAFRSEQPVFLLRVIGKEGRTGERVGVSVCLRLSELGAMLGNLLKVAADYDLADPLFASIFQATGLEPPPDTDDNDAGTGDDAGPDLTVCVWGRQAFVHAIDERVVRGTKLCENEPTALLATPDGSVAGAVCTVHAAVLREHDVFGSPALYPHLSHLTVPTATPGSEAALRQGCRCSPVDNRHGLGSTEGVYVLSMSCPVHGAP